MSFDPSLNAASANDAARGSADGGSASGDSMLASPASRRMFLRRSGLSVLAGAGAAGVILSPGSTAFGAAKPKLRSPAQQRDEFESIQAHENDHVAALVTALGNDARPKPNFKALEQAKILDFALVSQALENTGVGAYLAALPIINSMEITASAGTIALIEARHAGYLNTLLGDPVTGNLPDKTADNSFETALTIDQVAAAAMPFIADLNGGPDLTFSTTPSDQNDIAILNFALALEYLEAEFYNVNVPKFYKPKRAT